MINIQTALKSQIQSIFTNLIGYWGMSESAGNRADSVSGLTLTNNNSVGTAAGINGTAASSFIGTQSLTRATENAIQLGDFDFTFAGWVYFSGPFSSVPVAVTKYDTSQQQFYLYGEANSQMRLVLSSAASSGAVGLYAASFGALSTNTWYFVAAWHDSVNNVMGISVNGVTDTAPYSAGVYAAGTAPLSFGLDAFGTTLNGRLQKWGFWKKVLTTQDMAALYSNGNGLNYTFF